ncbi:KGG domain-containing protein [Janthinobacterium sp. GB1R12]|uniref:KGG domain-containing protein n=1 Tax=Janthinobacterium sp. GB1R12 TaxID=3424190 RepID=UPI003F288648
MATSSDNKQQGSKTGSGSSSGGSGGSKQSDTSKRGFASMDPAQQREIASEGGRAAHEKGTAHEFTSEEARRAGSQSHKNDANRQSAASSSVSRDNASMNQEGNRDSGNKQSGGSGSSSGSRNK